MNISKPIVKNNFRKGDWELDFYSRPILDKDGKKRWELLITNSQGLSADAPFRWEKQCPSNKVNSIWLSSALQQALEEAKEQGWEAPLRLRCWRSSMKTMIKRSASELGLEVLLSRRTYSLFEWLSDREKNFYPFQEGYIRGPIAPTPSPIQNQTIPLPESARGDALTLSGIELRALREAEEWPMEFSGLIPISPVKNEKVLVPGLRLFSKRRALALAGCLGALEPVKLVIEGKQLLLEAGQEDRWLVTDLAEEQAKEAKNSLINSRKDTNGLQFISVQKSPEDEKFAGFWMLKDFD